MLPERVAHARDLCARWVESGHTPTLGVCVARRGVIVLDEAFGVRGPGADSPRLDAHALFAGVSVTKAVTATLVMQLVDDGLLGLNRPAKDYLPEMSGEGTDEILVHHLLTHTSGYPFHTDEAWVSALGKEAEGRLRDAAVSRGSSSNRSPVALALVGPTACGGRGRGDGLRDPQLRAAWRDRPTAIGPQSRAAGSRAYLRSARHERQLLRGARVRIAPSGAARARSPDGGL